MVKQRLILWACALLAVGAACIFMIYLSLEQHNDVNVQDKPGMGFPQIGGNFTLTDQNGLKRSSTDFEGKYQLIYFGYSFCPDICPLGLQNISGALSNLGRNLDDVDAMFITVDPERDSVDNLKIYSTNFHPKLIMLTGTPTEIASIMKDYKVYAAKAKPNGTSADYLMDHTSLIYLIDRRGNFIKSFPHTIAPEELSGMIISLLAHEKVTANRVKGF